jgi:hypothetical protein
MDLQVKKKQKNQGPTIFSLHFLLFELRIDLEFERGTTSSTNGGEGSHKNGRICVVFRIPG